MHQQIPLYFKYWGKAMSQMEIDYRSGVISDEDICKEHNLSEEVLYKKANNNKWKKIAKGEKLITYHLLPYHCLDVAAVAAIWWDKSPAIRRSFARMSDIDEALFRAWILFFIALHDYGKFDIRFQRKAPKVWEVLFDNSQKDVEGLAQYECIKYDHGSAGLYWLSEDRRPQNDAEEDHDIFGLFDTDESAEDNFLLWIAAVVGHHGFVYPEGEIPDRSLSSLVSRKLSEQDRIARELWVTKLEKLFLHPAGLSLDDTPPEPSPLLAGFCSVSDWLGSRTDEENFCFKSESMELDAYFKSKQADAQRVLALSGMQGQKKPYLGVKSLLKEEYQPRQLQTLVDHLPDKSGLTIIEAPTGSGKTEAALAYAWRLLDSNLADSIIFAMPTQATANAMLQRIEQLAGKLFSAHPNIILAHGSARFNEDFSSLKNAGQTVQKNDEAWAQCSEWLAQSRKRVFLGQIGISTIDQVLISVLPVRHRFVRGFGIGRSVLIVDEVHAYDAYMYGLLSEVLKNQQLAGGSTILLSATLPQVQKQKLFQAIGSDWDKNKDQEDYPLVSWTAGQSPKFFYLPENENPSEHEVAVECLSLSGLLPDEELRQRIISAAESGAQVVIICNLVDVAQQLARTLSGMTDIQVDLFHARYCLTHRQQKEKKVIEQYGTEGDRKKGRILVATQVVEQSLDIDFDWLITQLCPVDLLFQRMGRLHRHDRQRPVGFEQPLCTVLLEPDDDYGVHGLIYDNTQVMWRTAEKLRLLRDEPILFPEAYRDWIEHVYQEEAWGNEPEFVKQGNEKFQDKQYEQKIASNYLIRFAGNPLVDEDEKVAALTRDSEMSLSVVPYLKTGNDKQLLDGVLFNQLSEVQQAEALAMNKVNVPGGKKSSWRSVLPVDELDESGVIWLLMKQEGEYWQTEGKRNTLLCYHPDWGMEKVQ